MRFNRLGSVQNETPEAFGGSDSALLPPLQPAYTIATPMTIQTRAYIRPVPVTPGKCQQCLPDKLPKFELGDDSYDYLMDLAMMIQVHGLDLDSWGAQAIMASVDTFYRGVLAPYLHVKPSPLWHEVCTIVGNMIKPLVMPEIARCQLAEGRMDIYCLFLVFMQMFEKMQMLTEIPKSSTEARTYFLHSLDCVVQRLLLNQFPLWIREGDLNAGYAFMNKSDETFQVVTRGDSQYEDLHCFLDRAVQCSLHPKIKGYAQCGNQHDDRLATGSGSKQPHVSDNCTPSAGGWPRNFTSSSNCNRTTNSHPLNSAHRRPFQADVRRTEVDDAVPVHDDSVIHDKATRGDTADEPTGQEDPVNAWDGANV
ncbi:hypothetical protein H4R20_005773 [Coemansia guatemalensis]|uniref:Uncharacterized protein n=1 Tax=Coemansia guatemalensis TaxID=2761395 RepID=A0A9W8HR25_9FUNG|nr:hypothetical protein H4R20_005773 [Coemansia guatemalensis]